MLRRKRLYLLLRLGQKVVEDVLKADVKRVFCLHLETTKEQRLVYFDA